MCKDERCRHGFACDCIEQCATRPARDVTALGALYARFEGFVGRRLPSADDALRDETLNLDPMALAWLAEFVDEWDTAAAWESRCLRENEAPWGER